MTRPRGLRDGQSNYIYLFNHLSNCSMSKLKLKQRRSLEKQKGVQDVVVKR